jgi:hypothetical protein
MHLILSGRIYTNRYIRDGASFRRSFAQEDALLTNFTICIKINRLCEERSDEAIDLMLSIIRSIFYKIPSPFRSLLRRYALRKDGSLEP